MTHTFTALSNSIPTPPGADPGTYDMLRDSLRQVPEITGMVLLSNDGIAMAAYGMAMDDAQRMAAACSGMASLAGTLSDAVTGGTVLHHALAMQGRNIIVTECGAGTTLLVVLQPSAPVGLALAETVRKARAYAEQMGTTPRAGLPTR